MVNRSQQNGKLLDIVAVSASGFVKLIDWRTSCCRHVSCPQHGLSICQHNTRYMYI